MLKGFTVFCLCDSSGISNLKYILYTLSNLLTEISLVSFLCLVNKHHKNS